MGLSNKGYLLLEALMGVGVMIIILGVSIGLINNHRNSEELLASRWIGLELGRAASWIAYQIELEKAVEVGDYWLVRKRKKSGMFPYEISDMQEYFEEGNVWFVKIERLQGGDGFALRITNGKEKPHQLNYSFSYE